MYVNESGLNVDGETRQRDLFGAKVDGTSNLDGPEVNRSARAQQEQVGRNEGKDLGVRLPKVVGHGQPQAKSRRRSHVLRGALHAELPAHGNLRR